MTFVLTFISFATESGMKVPQILTFLSNFSPMYSYIVFTYSLYSATAPVYSSAPRWTVFEWNHGMKVLQMVCMVGIVSGFEMFSNEKLSSKANSGFHCVMTRAWPGASISGMIVTPLEAHFCWMFSKSS